MNVLLCLPNTFCDVDNLIHLAVMTSCLGIKPMVVKKVPSNWQLKFLENIQDFWSGKIAIACILLHFALFAKCV